MPDRHRSDDLAARKQVPACCCVAVCQRFGRRPSLENARNQAQHTVHLVDHSERLDTMGADDGKSMRPWRCRRRKAFWQFANWHSPRVSRKPNSRHTWRANAVRLVWPACASSTCRVATAAEQGLPNAMLVHSDMPQRLHRCQVHDVGHGQTAPVPRKAMLGGLPVQQTAGKSVVE